MLLSKTAIMNWNSRNKLRYINLGYNYTKMRDSFLVKVCDLPLSSHALVVVKCDYCNKVMVRKYVDYLKCHDKNMGDACLDCCQTKREKTNIVKYGFKSSAQNSEVKEKQIKTIIEKYGCDSYFQTDEFKERCKATCLKRYGVEYPLQSEEIKNKVAKTNIERYGNICSLHGKEIAKKAIATNIKRYGVCHPMQSSEIRSKTVKTLYTNGTVATSKQQLTIYNMLLEIYDNCELNYPESYCSLDCMVIINDCKIDCEYDGWYWHQDEQKDRRRDEFLKQRGYKILRIKASHKVPTKEQLKEAIDYLVKGNHSYNEIILDI